MCPRRAGRFAFLLGQVAQQLTDAGIGGSPDGPFVKLLRLQLHQFACLRTVLMRSRSASQTGRALHEALDVLAAKSGIWSPNFCPIKIEEPVAMAVLLGAHSSSILGRRGMVSL